MNNSILINEVGLRDGLQNQPQLVSTPDKLRLIHALLDAGIKAFEVTSFVSPKAVPQMADAADLVRRLPQLPGVTYSALVPNLRGCERALEAGVRSMALVLAASDTMNRRNINMSFVEALAESEAMLRFARSNGVAMRAYVATAFGCAYEGHVEPSIVEDLVAQLFLCGADEVILADTIGVGDPMHVSALVGSLVSRHGAATLSVHFHDTKGLALANSYAAFEQGIRKFDASIGGLGGCPFAPGARGNAATEDLVNMFEAGGVDTGTNLEKLVEAVGIAESCIGQALGSHWINWRRGRRAQRQS